MLLCFLYGPKYFYIAQFMAKKASNNKQARRDEATGGGGRANSEAAAAHMRQPILAFSIHLLRTSHTLLHFSEM